MFQISDTTPSAQVFVYWSDRLAQRVWPRCRETILRQLMGSQAAAVLWAAALFQGEMIIIG